MDGQLRGSEKFTYDKSWEQIEAKLKHCETKQNEHLTALKTGKRLNKKQKLYHMKQFKGLEGSIATLRWVLGDADYDPLVGRVE